jgi:uncharacterized delta-60 repeat protein
MRSSIMAQRRSHTTPNCPSSRGKISYLPNGTLDTSWGGTGTVRTSLGNAAGSDAASAIALQTNGRVLLAGSCNNGAISNFCAVRYRSDGTLDDSWNGNGKVITSVGGNDDDARAIAIQPDGKVILVGDCSNSVFDKFCAVRYLTNGDLDLSWSGDGKVVTSIDSGDDRATAVVAQPDGKVLLGGECRVGLISNFCSLRYEHNGNLDAGWGTTGSGTVTTPLIGTLSKARGLALLPDGKVLQAGSCLDAGFDFCSVRFHGDGSLDRTWGVASVASTSFSVATDEARAIALQPDGKILLAGTCVNGLNDNFCVLRYDGGPFGYKACTLDLDGDGVVLATTDILIGARVAFGMTGDAAVNGIRFPSRSTRDSWLLISSYLATHCGLAFTEPVRP